MLLSIDRIHVVNEVGRDNTDGIGIITHMRTVMSQSNLNESSQRSHLDKLIDLLANKLNLQSAVLDDGDDNDKNSCQTNEDIEKIRKLFAARKSKSDKISLSVVTRKILGWKFFIVCLLFGIFHALLR